ncbi:MAG TPA: SCO family protein [Myxococcaceae bacterium]|nr:SCO family protein [Myxococcaceae bacterium]
MTHRWIDSRIAALLGVLLLPVMARADPGSEHCASRKDASDTASTTEVRLEEVPLLDQDGKPVRFRSEVLGDKLVIIDFVFTHCTTVCPVLSAILSRAQRDLGDRLEEEVRLVSITVDPTRDTPARLKAYSSKFGAKTGWTWLTGSQGDVKKVLEGLGAYTPDYANHAPMVLVGDPRTGRWARLNGFPSKEKLLEKVDELSRARHAAAPSEDKDRSYFTDNLLVTQEGKQVRFYSDVLKDRVVVISFLFTRCDTACPLLARKLKQLQARLGERFGREVHFISISVDPEHDTPERLKAFARKNQATHPGWTFLTGKKEDVNQVIARLGQYVEDIEGHSTLFIAGNVKKRHWTKLRPELPPAAIAEKVRLLAEGN